jgi:hypothetical protein
MHFLAAILAAEEMPELRPPKGPLVQGPWDQVWPWALLGGLCLAAFCAWWFWRRPARHSPPPTHPYAHARSALDHLLTHASDEKVRSTCARVMREYLAQVSGFSTRRSDPIEAWTTEEFLHDLGPAPFESPELGIRIRDFLADSDRQAYSADEIPDAGPVMVERARSLLEQIERQRHTLDMRIVADSPKATP